jgi:hypothetical protein
MPKPRVLDDRSSALCPDARWRNRPRIDVSASELRPRAGGCPALGHAMPVSCASMCMLARRGGALRRLPKGELEPPAQSAADCPEPRPLALHGPAPQEAAQQPDIARAAG